MGAVMVTEIHGLRYCGWLRVACCMRLIDLCISVLSRQGAMGNEMFKMLLKMLLTAGWMDSSGARR